jgi:uncharacterized protein (DUF2336 family)
MTGVIIEMYEGPCWTARAKSVERLASRFASGGLSEDDRHAVADALRLALYDSEPLVRRVLADAVKLAADLPHDILLALARDVAAVATPVLEHARALSEEDMLPIAQQGETAHRFAIAGRRHISERLAALLCRAGERAVMLRLLNNEGAALSEATLHRMLDVFPDHPAVAEAIGRRRLLPVSVGSRLFGPAPHREAARAVVWERTGSLG